MTLRRFVVFALVLAPLSAHADPQAELDAAASANAAASSEQAISAALAREEPALQRAVDRKLGAVGVMCWGLGCGLAERRHGSPHPR